MLTLNDVSKSFVMHLQGGKYLPVVTGVSLAVSSGECVVLGGASGAGKSSLLKMIYGNYRCDQGEIMLSVGSEIIDIAIASPRRILALRQQSMGYVSQFLRVIPRVAALEIVTAAARDFGLDADEAEIRSIALFRRLNIPERLWALPPATFSGGEQQRVNIARGFVADHPLLLLDEPTASLDAANRAAVVELIQAKKQAGIAVLGIFHDEDVRDQVADRIVDVTRFKLAA
jgi:alpha-D-ribose 1-methylphosphonate 5-triphosphate synthase subunit PhnL